MSRANHEMRRVGLMQLVAIEVGGVRRRLRSRLVIHPVWP
jgi:hypothetical protein